MGESCLTIDLSAIGQNWQALDALSHGNVETGAVVKADAYGLGIDQVAPVLAKAGARRFFVAFAREAIRLRAALGPDVEIIAMSGYLSGDAAVLRETGVIPALSSLDQIRRFREDQGAAPFALQLDTGMNRLGLEAADLPQALLALGGARPILVMSHLAVSDKAAHPMNATQLAAFAAMAMAFPGVPLSLAATGGILLGAPYHFAITRPGIGLYGGAPFTGAKPVVALDLEVIQTRHVLPGEGVGYGLSWVASRPSRIAAVSAGYADGLLRHLTGTLFAGNTPCPIVGRISMDTITVDVTGLEETPPTLSALGPMQGIDRLAGEKTIGYEILTSLGQRYARRYVT